VTPAEREERDKFLRRAVGSLMSRGRPICAETGWRMSDLWSTIGSVGGDDSVGLEFIAYYEAPRTRWRAEMSFWVVEVGGYPDDPEEVRYAVEECSEVWEEIDGDQEGLETSYEGGSYLSYPTIEAAEAEARRMAERDISFALFNPRTTEVTR
jgi:hypothetical protein